MQPVREIAFRHEAKMFVALVYETDPVLGVRDVTVFEVRDGGFRHLGCGVWGKRFVRVGVMAKALVTAVDTALREAGV
jgi:hypothetical protein